MKIFITGATGFIGSHVMKQALAAGHKVLALRRSPTSFPRIPLERQPEWLDRPIPQLTAEEVNGCDVFVHLAATGVSPRASTWPELNEVNVNGTIHMCSLAKQLQSSLVIAGSSAEYGLSGLRYEMIPPSAPLEPTFPYAASKAAACVMSTAFARSELISVSYLRVFNAFGEGQHEGNLWPSMRKAAIEGKDFFTTAGEQIRDFIPVEDVASVFVREAERHHHSRGDVIVRNIGSGNPQSIRQFCEHWWEKWQAKGRLQIGALPYRDGEVMRYVPEV